MLGSVFQWPLPSRVTPSDPVIWAMALWRKALPAQVLVQTILEGCINETLSAAEATWLSERATLRTIRLVQRQIAADETRHAALGWKTVRWLLQHPDLFDLAKRPLQKSDPKSPLLGVHPGRMEGCLWVHDRRRDSAFRQMYGSK